ncbi:MAG TPA: DNA translocase FtsK 4TM domain-containing protein, partial [Chitinophagales bacterium]
MENVEPKKTRARKIAESGADASTSSATATKANRVTKQEETVEEEVTPKWWNDGRLSKTTGLFLLLFSLLVFASITSYFFTAIDDRSEVANRAALALADGKTQVQNSMGRLGAVLSHVLVEMLFGFGSYIIGLLCFVTGFNLFFNTKQFRLLKWLVYGFFALVWTSALLAFLNFLILPDSILSWGGGFGNFLTGANGYFTGMVHPIGVALILFAYALIAVIWIFNYDFNQLFPKSNAEKTSKNADLSTPFEAFKDEDENIFGKDKIIANEEIAYDLDEEIADEIAEELPDEEDDDADLEMEIVQKPTNTSARSAAKNDDEELSLQVNKAAEEETGKTRGSIGTAYDPTQTLSNFQLPKLEFL